MARSRSYLTGFRELRALLNQLPQAVAARVQQQSVNAAATVWVAAVKSAAPRGSKRSKASAQYGALRINIKARSWRRVRKRGIKGSTVTTNNAFWGYMLEYGTGIYYTGPGGRSKGAAAKSRLRARPWFRPAVDASAGSALEAMRGRMAAGIAREAERLALRYRTR